MRTVRLAGYPEALLGRSSMTVMLPPNAVLTDVVTAVAAADSKLWPALLNEEARPRHSTNVLLDGVVTDVDTLLPTDTSVTVLAALPCDG